MPVSGLVAFPITPMDADGRVDLAACRRLVRRLVDAGVDAVGALGSTGSYPFLTRDERRRALAAAVEEAGGRVPVMAGIGALRTDEAIAHARDAGELGAAVGLLAAVSYTPLTEDEVFTHFAAVAEASGLPLCIYDNPGTTHFTIGDDLLARLSRIPGVVSVKSPAPPPAEAEARMAALSRATPAGFSVGVSTDWNAAASRIAGADAWYSVLAGLWPQPCVEIKRAVARGDVDAALAIDAGLQPVWDLFRRFSSLRTMYAGARILNLCDAAPPLPIRPLSSADTAEVERVFARLGVS